MKPGALQGQPRLVTNLTVSLRAGSAVEVAMMDLITLVTGRGALRAVKGL